MDYLVVEDRPLRCAVVHRVDCNRATDFGRRPLRTGEWHGPFGTKVAALAAASRTKLRDVRSCQCCVG